MLTLNQYFIILIIIEPFGIKSKNHYNVVITLFLLIIKIKLIFKFINRIQRILKKY